MTKEITNQEELSAWVREQFQRANKHLAQEGILFDTVATEESRYLAPYVAVWKIKDTKGEFYWVISGDLPADAVSFSAAKDAREVLRYFSFTWQAKAENIVQAAGGDQIQVDFAKLLVTKAEMLYQVYNDKTLWQEVS